MRILFVYPNANKAEFIQMGIASLSAYLKEHGHKTALIDLTWHKPLRKHFELIKRFKPDLIAFSSVSCDFEFSLDFARKIKKRFNTKIIFGGVHPTVDPLNVLKKKVVDMICIGEGEEALLELANNPERTDIKNIWFKKDGKIIRNPVRPLIKDLDKLPFPDREIFDFKRYLFVRDGAADMLTGRGCPFSCSYCINSHLAKLYGPEWRRVRKRSVDNVLEEIGVLVNKHHCITLFDFRDDTFIDNVEWLNEFADKYSKRFKIPFACITRPEYVNENSIKLLKKAGCSAVKIGIESGSETIRRNVLHRPMSNELIKRAFRIAKAAGLKTYSFNMIGVPFETKENIWETIDINREVQPDLLQVSIFQPFKGTEIRELCKKEGFLTNKKMPRSLTTESIMNYPNLKRRDIKKLKKRFMFYVYNKKDMRKALLFLARGYLADAYIAFRDLLPNPLKRKIFSIFYYFFFRNKKAKDI